MYDTGNEDLIVTVSKWKLQVYASTPPREVGTGPGWTIIPHDQNLIVHNRFGSCLFTKIICCLLVLSPGVIQLVVLCKAQITTRVEEGEYKGRTNEFRKNLDWLLSRQTKIILLY